MSNLTEMAKENGALVEGPCKSCDGSGVIMETITVPVCCGRCSPHGDCCGNPDPAQEYQPAPCQCGGLTFMHLTPDQLQATVEQVCGPLVDALKAAPILSMFNNAEEFISSYEKWRDAVKIPASINYGRLIGKYGS